jgi:hypothetical protein
MFILFGGLFSPPPQMAAGARWFCYIDPITYAFRAIIPQQFYAGGGEFDVGAGRQLLAGPTPPCGVPGVPPGVPCGGGVMVNAKSGNGVTNRCPEAETVRRAEEAVRFSKPDERTTSPSG